MIKSWKHKGLQKLYLSDDASGVQAKDVERLKLRLQVLDEASSTDEFKHYPGFRFHPLKGDRQDLYAITVRANWRITFQFIDGDAYILNLEDYH
ncbi:MAG: type II toxin-antitoxin system RelE/ParE family toxin [Mixta calida]|uniref:type II toxin-antitoxin system RelE/ParE family toxin n=1 Tax=Pantoea TaxID=53335 RepID=UPI0006601052|nr:MULTISPECIES: type II toxin-antitoxin system RelE/ParE family toxin [Pantoea]MBS6437740.1 type II toxin-antitoxin system RelE/ParE family toxin [Pantoea sp.]MDU1574331.1 type II toxin-antitoxin system RelE/ParE family toxin [Pantoea sp.]MDU2729313.1 type II toxin-antitoxin system RelE/ParE family toxin [Pantoea sp.]MDU2734904.1 type II toxin-antitoxin system RelE/ParE family toxin [Mixta calida]